MDIDSLRGSDETLNVTACHESVAVPRLPLLQQR
jgi:hypothetical protein